MKNKKLMIVVMCVVVAIVASFVFISTHNNTITDLKEVYEEDPTVTNLYELCKVLFTDGSNSDIIEYFPNLLQHRDFEKMIANDTTDDLSIVDMKNIYTDVYIFACYEELDYDEFKERFIEIFPCFVYEKDSSSDYTIYLQSHFWTSLTPDKELTKDFIDVLKIIYEDETLPIEQRKDGYMFISKWYGDIGDLDSHYETKKSFNALADEDEITLTDEQIDEILEYRASIE